MATDSEGSHIGVIARGPLTIGDIVYELSTSAINVFTPQCYWDDSKKAVVIEYGMNKGY